MIRHKNGQQSAFHSITANVGQKKTEIVPLLEFLPTLPNGGSTMLKRWERLDLDCPLLVALYLIVFPLWAFLWHLFRTTAEERRVVWEEAKAILVKTTPWKYGWKTAVISVLCRSALSFLALHYWSNNILVFGALFTSSCCSILYSFLLPLQWLITLVINASDWGKKKEYVKFWGNASSCSPLHLCHTF